MVPDDCPIYLDNHATTAVDPRIVGKIVEVMSVSYGNANSADSVFGEAARRIIDEAAQSVASVVNAESENVHFTSGATEAIQLAIGHAVGTKRDGPLRVAISRAEHSAVIDTVLMGAERGLISATWIEVDGVARISSESLERALHEGADLVCIQAANNEVGTIHPIDVIASQCSRSGASLLVDASQAVGRVPLDYANTAIDYMVISGHKIYGPKGVGALVSAKFKMRQVYGLSGSHEGTPNVPGIHGLGEACNLMKAEGSADNVRITSLRDQLQAALMDRLPNLVVNGDPEHRLSTNLHISAVGALNELVIGLLRRQVTLSTGSACHSGTQGPSHVLRAMGMSDSRTDSALRIGLGRFTTAEDVDAAARAIADAVVYAREIL